MLAFVLSHYDLMHVVGGADDQQQPPLRGGETIFHTKQLQRRLFSKGGSNTHVAPVQGRLCMHWTGHDYLHEVGLRLLLL